MSKGHGGLEPELLVTAEDQSFGSAVADAVEETKTAATAEHVGPVTDALTQRRTDDFEGAIVDGRIANLAAVVEHLTERAELPVVVLSDSAGDDDTIARAIEAGAMDVFLRTTTSAQYELVVERLVAAANSRTAGTSVEREGPDLALFERIPDGLIVNDPATSEIVDVNEQFCAMHGYDRSELVGETIDTVTAPDETHGLEAAQEMIQQACTEGPQRFEWRNQRHSGETFPVEVSLTMVELGGAERVLPSVEDITERKRREQDYERIFNGVEDAIAVFDPDTGEITEVNEPYHDMIGYDDLETIRELGIEGLSAGGAEYTEERGTELIREVSDTDDPRTVEWQAETASGDRRHLEITLSPAVIRGEQRVLTIQRDVTERKRREQEYEQIFNMAGDGIVIHDPESGDVVDANQQVADLLGYDRETFVDRPISEFQSAGEGISGQQAREKIQESAEMDGQEFEWPLETSDGETVWVRTRHETGEIDGERRIVAILQDITERRRREQEYEQIFHGVNDSITIHDPETGELLDVNDALCDLLGHDRDEVIENGVMEYTPSGQGYTIEEAKAFIREVVETGESKRTEWAVETADGEIRQLEVTGTTVEIGGELRYVAIDRDITERKRREQRLEVFNRILRHNLRNQLDVIRSHAEELATRTANEHPDRIIDSVDELATIGSRARKIDRLMSTAETLTEVDIARTLREAIETMEPRQTGVTVTTEFPSETRLWTDEEAVTMAVESALENALEHARSAVTVAIENCPEGLGITIEDDGPGIPGEELTPIESGGETNLQHGRGLGLWQLRWCVDTLNGELSFETGTGTTVRITVPDRRGSNRSDRQ